MSNEKWVTAYYSCGHNREFEDIYLPHAGTQILCIDCRKFVFVIRGRGRTGYRARCVSGDCKWGKKDPLLKELIKVVKSHVATHHHETWIYDIEKTRKVIMKISLENSVNGSQQTLDSARDAV